MKNIFLLITLLVILGNFTEACDKAPKFNYGDSITFNRGIELNKFKWFKCKKMIVADIKIMPYSTKIGFIVKKQYAADNDIIKLYLYRIEFIGCTENINANYFNEESELKLVEKKCLKMS